MDAWWVTLLREQQSDGFPDLAGASATIVLPISDRLISRIVAARIPPTVPIREFELLAESGNTVTIRFRLSKPAFLPGAQLQLRIERQPELPASPTVVLAIVSRGVASVALRALTFADVLPPGIHFDGKRFTVDLATVDGQRGAGLLSYFTELEFTTVEGRLIVRARGGLPARS